MSFQNASIGNLKMDCVRSPLIQPNNAGCTKRKMRGNDGKKKEIKVEIFLHRSRSATAITRMKQ
jgi:hypothetical protein